jgi:hypothetical protein
VDTSGRSTPQQRLGSGLSGLGAVNLIGYHRQFLALRGRQLARRLQGEREGLDGAQHDLLAAGEMAALAAVLSH